MTPDQEIEPQDEPPQEQPSEEVIDDFTRRSLFKQRFVEVISHMGEQTQRDPEAMWLIGSLAADLLDQSKSPNWRRLKKTLSPSAHGGLINTFHKQGNQLAANGNKKAAFAIEVLALSVIAPTLAEDEHIASGDKLLNKMIGDCIAMFREGQKRRSMPQ